MSSLVRERDIAVCRELLTSDHEEIRLHAIGKLGKIGEPAVPMLKEILLKSDDYAVLTNAITALGEIGSPSAVPVLEGLLGNNWYDHGLTKNAITALGKIGSPSAVDALTYALNNPVYGSKEEIAEALGNIGDHSAVPALIEAVVERGDRPARYALEAIGPRNPADLKIIHAAAQKAKDEGKDVSNLLEVYREWSRQLKRRAKSVVDKKRFPKHKARKPDKVPRVRRVVM